jgi:hypothetical protein
MRGTPRTGNPEIQKTVDQQTVDQQAVDQQTVDQRRQELRRWIDVSSDILATNGSVVETWRTRAGRRCGPYFQLAYRQEGRQRRHYLGADRVLVDEVRTVLNALQSGTRMRRTLRQHRKVVSRRLAASRRAWNQELEKIGLCLKGSEVRGWRGAARAGQRVGRADRSDQTEGVGNESIQRS